MSGGAAPAERPEAPERPAGTILEATGEEAVLGARA